MVAGEASNAVEAVELVKTHKLEVLLLDVDMPGRTGLHYLKIRAAAPGVRVVILSARPSETYAEAALRGGAFAYLEKATEPARMEGYLAARVMTEGLKRIGSRPTRESLVTALETLREESFGGFMVSFSPTDHVASRFVEMSRCRCSRPRGACASELLIR